MTPQAKALMNGAKRPLKTSALNPYAMRRVGGGIEETRISPRIPMLNKQWAEGKIQLPGHHRTHPGRNYVAAVAENKTNYVPGSRAEGRQAAADMVRRYRKTGYLSAVARLTELNARLSNR